LGSEQGVTTQPFQWRWQGHDIRCIRCGDPEAAAAAVLIHGFGASLGHWRHNLPSLAAQVEAFGLDLLGFGDSDKPRSRLSGEPDEPDAVRYCFDLWAEQVADFVSDHVQIDGLRPVHLIGNSIGGVVALVAARLLTARGRPPAQVILIDCATRALDDKRVGELPAWERSGRPLIKRLVRQRWLLAPLFRLLAQPWFVRSVLLQAYPSGANVDDALVKLLVRPANDSGAVESFRGFVNLFDDYLAPALLAELRLPVRMLWGERDPWEDPAEARRWQHQFACIQELRVLEGLGHCPHDEDPDQVNPILLEWLAAND
jgi:pimeloyl-ACP methyl ester carboxylesterase